MTLKSEVGGRAKLCVTFTTDSISTIQQRSSHET